jgi:hypothetical protein
MAEEKVTRVDSSAAFDTREKSNEGIVVPLYLPTGEKTDKWMRIRGAESDAAREAFAEAKRAMLAISAIDDEKVKADAIRAEEIKLTAALVSAWNLVEPCDQEHVVERFRKSPQLMRMVDRVSEDRTLFFGVSSPSLPDSLSPNSDSTSAPQDSKEPSATG